MRVFGDLHQAAVVAIRAVDSFPVEGRTPKDLQARLPFVRVTKPSGSDDRITDRATIDVDVYAATRAEAMRIANVIREHLTSQPHRVVIPEGVMVIDRARTVVAPFDPPPPSPTSDGTVMDPNIRRVAASYSISARRVWAS